MNTYSKSIALIEDSDTESPFGGFTAVLSTPSLDRDGDRLLRSEWQEPLPERLPLDIDHGMSVADTIGSFRPYFDGDVMMMDATFASTPKAQEVRTLIKEGHINSVSIAFMSDKSKKEAGGPFREVLNAGVVSTPSNRDALIMASKAATVLADTIRDTDVDTNDIRKALDVPAIEADDRTVGQVISDLFNFDGTKSADEPKKGIYIDVIPRFDMKAFAQQLADGMKASGGDAALISAIHDASVHLGAMCVQLQQDEEPSDDAQDKAASEEPVEKSFDEAFDDAVKTASVEAGQPEESHADSSADEEPAPDVKSAAASADAADDAHESEGEVEDFSSMFMEIELLTSEF